MALQKVMFSISIIQMVFSLVTLAMCSIQYFSADNLQSTAPNIAVYFALRALPNVTLLMSGIIGIVSSCLASKISKAVYITLTIQSSVYLMVLVWYFSYWIEEAQTDKNKESDSKCLAVTVLSLVSCLAYLTSEVARFLIDRFKDSNRIEIDSEKGVENTFEVRY